MAIDTTTYGNNRIASLPVRHWHTIASACAICHVQRTPADRLRDALAYVLRERTSQAARSTSPVLGGRGSTAAT